MRSAIGSAASERPITQLERSRRISLQVPSRGAPQSSRGSFFFWLGNTPTGAAAAAAGAAAAAPPKSRLQRHGVNAGAVINGEMDGHKMVLFMSEGMEWSRVALALFRLKKYAQANA
jgi:hypothetical protein